MELENSTEMENDIMVKLDAYHSNRCHRLQHSFLTNVNQRLYYALFLPVPVASPKKESSPSSCCQSSDHLNEVLAKTLSVILANGTTERSDLRLSMANGIWIDKHLSLKPSLKELLENSYKATCNQVDFASNTIRGSTLMLANAVYFKGFWSKKLDAYRGYNEDFHLLDGTYGKVPYMTNSEDQYLEDYDSFQVLRLPYVENQYLLCLSK
ncbi:hypothetical protein Bca4012_020969 [Brassica carinata]